MFAVLFIPNFPLQSVLRHEPDLRARAIALVDPQFTKPVIIQLTAAARAFGACEGLTASQATARCAELLIKPRSLTQETSATEILLQTAYAFSPNIEATAPGVCTLELKGLPFLSDNAAMNQWAEKILIVLAQFYIEAKIGFAETPELALLAAQKANPILLLGAQKTGTSSIESFPISALAPPPEILEILKRWGIQTVGQLLALGKDSITERLGPIATELFNRVSPDSPRPLKLVAPTEEFSEQMEFENEIETAEPLLFVIRRFVEQLSRRLELIYLVISEFQLQLGLSSGSKYERLFKVPAPTGNIEILFRMLQTHLETVHTDSPIVSLRLIAKPAKPDAQQFGLFESTLRDPNQFAETLAQLTALCGSDRVGTPESIPTHKPDSFRIVVPEFNNSKNSNSNQRVNNFPLSHRMGEGSGEGPIGLNLRRFRSPLPSQIELRDGKPALLRSHLFIGPIVESRGPFFSSGNWWDAGKWQREEWDIQTSDGSLFRIFRSAENYFLEGVYD
jgi:protein ImuB